MVKRRKKPTVEQNMGRLARKTAEILRDRPWIRGQLGDQVYGMCAMGAISFTKTGSTYTGMGRDPLVNALIERFGTWLQLNGFTTCSSVISFNDRVVKDKDELISYLEKFADELDPQQL